MDQGVLGLGDGPGSRNARLVVEGEPERDGLVDEGEVVEHETQVSGQLQIAVRASENDVQDAWEEEGGAGAGRIVLVVFV